MNAVLVNKWGGPEQLELSERTVPEPGEGEVQIKVMAAGVNPVETYIRAGRYGKLPPLPWCPGREGAGVVSKVGAGVENYNVGDRVYLMAFGSSAEGGGTYSQYTVAPTKDVNALPENVSFEQGACIGVAYRTAFRALVQRVRARAGDVCLVHGASGAVGSATVQLAKSMGLTVIGTAGTEAGIKGVLTDGADMAVNHREEGYMEAIKGKYGGVDVVIEMLANVNLSNDLKLLNRGGTVAVVGNRGNIEISPRDLMLKESSVIGVLGAGTPRDQVENRAAIAAGLRSGVLKPRVGPSFALKDAAAAQIEVIEHKQGTTGKIVIKPWD